MALSHSTGVMPPGKDRGYPRAPNFARAQHRGQRAWVRMEPRGHVRGSGSKIKGKLSFIGSFWGWVVTGCYPHMQLASGTLSCTGLRGPQARKPFNCHTEGMLST